jgi:hypothetical protein
LLATDKISGNLSHPTAVRRVLQQLLQMGSQVCCLVDEDGRSPFDQLSGRLAKIPGVRTEDARNSLGGRLDHALSPPVPIQASPDETHVCQPPSRLQFADGIPQDDRRE